MRMKNFYMPTLRELPREAEIPSHIYLLRAGMIRMSAMGVYSYLNLGLRVIQKIEKIVRKYMDKYGGQEVLMSILQSQDIWEASGRWKTFGPEMFKLKDRHDRGFCLGPTAEEFFTSLVKDELNTYKKLPLNIYQIQNKYRDEKRPRFGINRSREFIMKDAYSFDKSFEDMEKSFMNMWKAYVEIFDELKLDYKIVEGDTGSMGGRRSVEFTALSDVGEGAIAYCNNCNYRATDEKASVVLDIESDKDILDKEKLHTPGLKTIEDLSRALGVDERKCIKAIDFKTKDENIFVFIPGDRELNITKLVNYLNIPEHELTMMSDEDILSASSFPGFTSPMNLSNSRIILDKRLTEMRNLVMGSNEKDYHYINANYKRDFDGEVVDDLLMVKEGDLCPICGHPLHIRRGIEVGNIFELGTKYSESLDAKFLDENGREQYFVMGSYGIGISRTVSAIVEQNHDDKGIIWPLNTAPYHAIITIININNQEQVDLAEKMYESLLNSGVEVLLDDRKERAGVKFNDRDLIGIPLRITVGKKANEGLVEFSTRKDMKNELISYEDALNRIISLIKEM